MPFKVGRPDDKKSIKKSIEKCFEFEMGNIKT